ncbi:MAG: hypothetical protein ABGX07_17010, partial [Pirellulaceae bacterium]
MRRNTVASWVTAILLVATLSSYSSAEGLNSLSSSESKAGWKLLFDGKTTGGWRNYKKDTIG